MSSHTLAVHLPFKTLEALGEFTGKWWSDTFNLEPFVCQAIDNFVKQAPAAEQPAAAPSEAGYQWKQVFLPEGTRLRATFGKQPYYATVDGAEIKYGERAVSPSCFANLQGSGNRNALKAIWLRLPGSEEWLLADVWRSARKAAIARLLGNGSHSDLPSQENLRLPQTRPTAGGSVDGVRVGSAIRDQAKKRNILVNAKFLAGLMKLKPTTKELVRAALEKERGYPAFVMAYEADILPFEGEPGADKLSTSAGPSSEAPCVPPASDQTILRSRRIP